MNLKKFIKKVTDVRYREFKLFFGQPRANDNVIYLIRFFHGEGLMSMAYRAIAQVEYARSKGYTPYIDLKHFRNIYRGLCEKGENPWEIFFQQPKAMEKSGRRKYIISACSAPFYEGRELWDYFSYHKDEFPEKKARFSKEIRLNNDAAAEIEKLAERLQVMNCTGVYVRGTDYQAIKPFGHPVQPALEDVIKKTHEYCEKYGQRIFLVTEDSRVMKRFCDEFGDAVLALDEDIRRIQYFGKKLLFHSLRSGDKLAVAKTYLYKIYLLAQCDRLIAGRTNGSVMALIINGGKYKDTCVYRKGFYGFNGN